MQYREILRESNLYREYKLFKLRRYNKKNNLKIKSIYASLKASYGKEVLISKDTYIADDVEIGDYSYVNANSSLENCTIGKFCSISSGVHISPWEHNLNHITTHPVAYENCLREREKVRIGNDVLISLNCIILEGIVIGDGAVIGAGAVVTKDVLPYEVVGGVPAKHIKFRFDENEIKKIRNLEWWNWSKEKINMNLEFLQKKSTQIWNGE